jgi:hypothetical protein
MIRIALLLMTILLTVVLLASGIGTATALRSKQSGARHPPSPATEHKGSKRHIEKSPEIAERTRTPDQVHAHREAAWERSGRKSEASGRR